MIGAVFYYPLYLLIVLFITLSVYRRYYVITGNSTNKNVNSDLINSFIIALIMSIFIGFRPESWLFVDMMNYIKYYSTFYEDTNFIWDWNAENKIFDNIFALFGSLNLGIRSFFVLVSFIYFITAWIACKRLFPNDVMIAYVVFLGAFSTFSYGTNGIKAGAAASLFLMALSYRENIIPCIFWALMSWGFHHSMVVPVTALILTHIFKNNKWYFRGWLFCLLMAILHVSYFQHLFAGMADETGSSYLTTTGEDWAGKGGFRIDFILYGAMPILVGYYAVYKKKLHLSKMYSSLLQIYLFTNGIWLLCIYANFTNRIAYLSWLLYPVVLIYPFLNENWGHRRYRTCAKVILFHLCFTIFMYMIYYNGFARIFK